MFSFKEIFTDLNNTKMQLDKQNKILAKQQQSLNEETKDPEALVQAEVRKIREEISSLAEQVTNKSIYSSFRSKI